MMSGTCRNRGFRLFALCATVTCQKYGKPRAVYSLTELKHVQRKVVKMEEDTEPLPNASHPGSISGVADADSTSTSRSNGNVGSGRKTVQTKSWNVTQSLATTISAPTTRSRDTSLQECEVPDAAAASKATCSYRRTSRQLAGTYVLDEVHPERNSDQYTCGASLVPRKK